MTVTTDTEAVVSADDETQGAAVAVPQVDVDALMTEAQGKDAIAFALMTMVKTNHAEYLKLDEAYKALRSKGETPVSDLLAGITDSEDAKNLKIALDKLEERLAEYKEKARELLSSRGMISTAEEAELKEKRDNVRKQINSANDLFTAHVSSRANLKDLLPFVEVFKTRASNAVKADADENARVRVWAAQQNPPIAVAERGRIKGEVIEAYRKAVGSNA